MISRRDTVVLLHGLARTSAALQKLQAQLDEAGYRAVALDYPSRTGDLATLCAGLSPSLAALARDCPGRMHFVGHSLGGIIARRLIATDRPRQLGRLVMLGPPNHGSAIADLLVRTRALRPIALRAFGPSLTELTTTSHPIFPAPDYDLGVIAGTRSIDPLGWLWLSKPNDGRVTVAATRIVNRPHLTLPVSHALMCGDARVIAATARFLATGSFRATDHV